MRLPGCRVAAGWLLGCWVAAGWLLGCWVAAGWLLGCRLPPGCYRVAGCCRVLPGAARLPAGSAGCCRVLPGGAAGAGEGLVMGDGPG